MPTNKPHNHPDRSDTAALVEHVAEQLGHPRDFAARAMFGGHGLYRDGVFFGIAYAGRLYLRASDRTRNLYTDRGMGRFRPSETQTLKNYYEVPADVLDDRAQLRQWTDAAVRDAAEL